MNNTGVTGLTAKKKKTLSMRVFGPRNSAYAVNLTYATYRHISREISIEHPSVGLASLTQLLKSVCVHFAYGKIALMLELLGRFGRFLDDDDRCNPPVLLIPFPRLCGL